MKYTFCFDSNTVVYILRHTEYPVAALVFLLTIVHHKYSYTRYLYQGH